MTALLHKIKSRVTIHAHRRVRGLLEGEYTSVFHGRSIDFDDVRHYVPGDEVKDIDWKATARMGAPMTRRYIASRKHTLMLIADTGRSMAALAPSGETKRAIAVFAGGVLGYLATRHGDLVGVVAGDADHTEHRRPESTDTHLERVLQLIHRRTTLDSGASDLASQLAFVARSFRRRMVLVVLADDRMLTPVEIATVRRLAVQHEILWLTIADADPMRTDWLDSSVVDVDALGELPASVRGDRRLRERFAASTIERENGARALWSELGISRTRIESEADVVPALFRLLEVHRHARR
ncbi:DUF58 domain-containing protein [Marisediminicola sp. LYQ85]|uniref:DUF58 domain-containing protein n=1 Tax=Marisediminicola sp. LYQ85 TaxID=3391062 RepID=UPI00398375AF